MPQFSSDSNPRRPVQPWRHRPRTRRRHVGLQCHRRASADRHVVPREPSHSRFAWNADDAPSTTRTVVRLQLAGSRQRYGKIIIETLKRARCHSDHRRPLTVVTAVVGDLGGQLTVDGVWRSFRPFSKTQKLGIIRMTMKVCRHWATFDIGLINLVYLKNTFYMPRSRSCREGRSRMKCAIVKFRVFTEEVELLSFFWQHKNKGQRRHTGYPLMLKYWTKKVFRQLVIWRANGCSCVYCSVINYQCVIM